MKNRTTVVVLDKDRNRVCDSSFSWAAKDSKPTKLYHSIQWYQYTGEHLKSILFLETDTKGAPKRSTKINGLNTSVAVIHRFYFCNLVM
ncbi:MAG: hypothetical protein HWD58_00820 [Bacteroidota bacterium]|nr:MAG: hypothetical protein HWD58_00820 [Bacteroidota bacterium]